MKEFEYYIWQNGLKWPAAGFAAREDAELLIIRLRKDWPASTFQLTDASGNDL